MVSIIIQIFADEICIFNQHMSCKARLYIYSKPFGFSLNYVLQSQNPSLLIIRSNITQSTATIHSNNSQR
jgi:hypothetical protein